jgi:peptidoglycan hydrolase-like protein with peptidoglycan-binding domain
MTWRPANCLTTLKAQIDAAHPDRPKASDGMIASSAHHAQNPNSDHEPNAAGVVTAWDITTADFTDALAERLRVLGKTGDGRVKYVIYKRRIASSRDGWAWRPYTGTDPHLNHIHLSVSADPAQYDRTDAWHLIATPPKPPAPKPRPFPLPVGHWFGVESADPRNHSGLTKADAASIQRIRGRLAMPAGNRYDKTVARRVTEFQKLHKIAVDGKVGPQTWAALKIT